MFEFLGKAVDRALKARRLSREEFAYKALPLFLLDLIQKYLRVTTQGTRYIPKKGPCIVVANHSGYMAFDALMLAHQIYLHTKRIPRIIAHKLWFLRPAISVHAKKMGLVPATFENGLKLLERGQVLILFPEGEEGNFKSSRYRYRLRRFRRGFVRLALATGAPIIPVVVIGAEETHITLSQLRWAKALFGIIIPIPLNVIPFPAKWTIKFGQPIRLERDLDRVSDITHATKISQDLRMQLQKEMNVELKKRKTVYL